MKIIRVIFQKIYSEEEMEELTAFSKEMMEKGFDLTIQTDPNICDICGNLMSAKVESYNCNECARTKNSN